MPSDENRLAEMGFDGGQGYGNGWLGNMQGRCGRRQVAVIGGGNDIAILLQRDR
jgi:hypothetical protein